MAKGGYRCSICFENDQNLCPITETDKNNYTIISKLRSCVSEIEWKDSYLICHLCNNNLDLVYEFREKCLHAESLRTEESIISESVVKVEVEEECIKDTFESTPEILTPVLKPVIISTQKKEKDSKFKCEFCECMFKTYTQLVKHSVIEHSVDAKDIKAFVCHVCNRRFINSKNLNQHLSYHKEERNFVCTFCGKSFKTHNDLHVHEKIHLNNRAYKCDECPKNFNTHKNLYTHKIVVHTDRSLWKYTCEICPRKFPMKSSYDAHMRRHNNDRKFGCHLCNKKFLDKSTAQKHLLSHSNHRDYKCEICNREYKERRILEIHQRKIHGIGDIKVPERTKKFLCHLCPKAYFDKNKLTRHMFSHTGEKPYFCTICPKRFIDVSYLNQHMKNAHNIVKNLET